VGLPLRRVEPDRSRPGAPDAWYWRIPAVVQLRDRGLDLDSSVTVLVGENGSGKSTLVSDAVAAGSQVLLATHSPLLAAMPGARMLELDDDGITPRDWADLDLVRDWREFLAAPDRLLRHLAE
jgi:predicted ATPase